MKLLYHILIITLMTAPLAQAQSFWDQYSEKVFKAGVGLCLVVGGYKLFSQDSKIKTLEAEKDTLENKVFILSTKYNNLIEAHEYLKKNSNSNFKIVDDGLQELKLISKRNAGSLQLLNDKYKKLKAELSGLCEGTIWSFSTLQNKIENINDTISQLDAQRRDEVERLNKNLTEKITSETNTRENSFNHQQKQIQALDDKHSDLATLTLQVSRSVIGLQTVFATKNSFFSKRTEHYFKQSNDSIKKHAAPVGSLGNLNDFNTLD